MSPGRALLIALLVAARAEAAGYVLGGSLGGGGVLLSDWGQAGNSHSATFDFEADATFSGTPIRPGLLQLAAAAKYRVTHSLYSQGNATNQLYGFRVNIAGLSETVLPVQLFASRDWGDFMSDLGAKRTGESIVTSLGASAQLLIRGYPTVRLLILRNIVENTSLGSERTVAGTTTLSVGVGHSIGTQTYSAAYDTAWNTGTWAENNYQSHSVAISASAAPTEKTLVRLNERYYLRLPFNNDPRNPRYDDNAFNAGFSRPDARISTGIDYGFRDFLVTSPAAPTIGQTSHVVSGWTSAHLSPDADLTANASALANNERSGTQRAWGESETAGMGVAVRHKFNSAWQANAGAGGTVGLTEPSTGGLLVGYGGSATVGLIGGWTRVRGNASYSIQYQSNLSGVPGWTLLQRGTVNADSGFGALGLRASLMAIGSRRTDALLGTFVGRSLTLALGATFKRYTATLSGGISDGISDALANPIATDGLFLPAPYNTQTRFATLTAGANFDSGRLYVGIILRTLSSDAPLRPNQWEDGASLTASYTIGAFIFSLEERFSTGGVGATWQRGNLVMLRVTRGFNWGF